MALRIGLREWDLRQRVKSAGGRWDPGRKVWYLRPDVAERLDLLRELDAVVMGALEKHDLMTTVWQCPTVLVPVRLDGRGQELAVIRPVLSERAMTARPAWVGVACASEITDALMAFDAIGAVAIDVTTKPPATIEWE